MICKVDCCPNCLEPNRSQNIVCQARDGVTAFYACRCGHKWTTSYLLEGREVRELERRLLFQP